MARLYADEDFPLPVVAELRRLGHDVRTVQEAGRAGQRIADDVVFADAVTAGRRDIWQQVRGGIASWRPTHRGL
jgi:hypothetical protein